MGLSPRRFESFPLRSSARLLCLYYPLAADVAFINVVADNPNSRKPGFRQRLSEKSR